MSVQPRETHTEQDMFDRDCFYLYDSSASGSQRMSAENGGRE